MLLCSLSVATLSSAAAELMKLELTLNQKDEMMIASRQLVVCVESRQTGRSPIGVVAGVSNDNYLCDSHENSKRPRAQAFATSRAGKSRSGTNCDIISTRTRNGSTMRTHVVACGPTTKSQTRFSRYVLACVSIIPSASSTHLWNQQL